jgi:hypothetical protein
MFTRAHTDAMRRFLLFLLIASSVTFPAAAAWKKAYFGSTPAGSWARYSDSTPDMKMTTTIRRLDDEDGNARIELLIEFANNEYTPVHNNYTLKKDFPLNRKLIDFMSEIQGGSVASGDAEAMAYDAATIEAINSNSAKYEPTAKFQGTETIGGKKADRYSYTIRYESKHESMPSTTETGEVWLSDAVPFGLLKQSSVTKDDKGNVTMKYERALVESGLKP